MDAYSMDLRKRVLKDVDAGLSTESVATKYSVSSAWVRRLKQRRRETGEIGPRSSRPKSVKKTLEPHYDLLRSLVRADADATLDELLAQLPVRVSSPTLCRALQELKLTFKKKSSTPPSRIVRMSSRSVTRGKPR
jgi:transposase